MLPLAVYGAGRELGHWPAPWRVVAYAAMVVLLAALHANLGFG